MLDHIVTMNPIAITQFFHIICIAIINHLLVFKKQNSFLKRICDYYSNVETNSRNIFYLHYIL